MTTTDNELVGTIRKNAKERFHVARTEFKGWELVDIRVFTDDEEPIATRKGVSIRRDLVPDLIDLLQEAVGIAGSPSGQDQARQDQPPRIQRRQPSPGGYDQSPLVDDEVLFPDEQAAPPRAANF